MKKTNPKPPHPWGKNLIKAMDAKGISVPDLARSIYPDDEKASGALVDKIHQWRSGEVDKPRGEDLEKVAAKLGTTEERLRKGQINRPGDIALLERPAPDRLEQGGKWRNGNGNDFMADGIKVEDLGQLTPEQARHLRAGVSEGQIEVWRLTSDVLEDYAPAYPTGELVVVDLEAKPRPGKIVLAETDGDPIFRWYSGFRLYAFSPQRNISLIDVDNKTTVIKGVVIFRLPA